MDEIRDRGRRPSSTSATPRARCVSCATRVLVLDKGRLEFDGDVDEGIHFLKYDDVEPGEEEADDGLGADI